MSSPRKGGSKQPQGPLPPALLEAVADRFRVLAAPSRLRILDTLLPGPLGMAELAEATGLSQSNLSRQVAELESAGCVRRTRVGREVTVEVADETLGPLCDLVCEAMLKRADDLSRMLHGS